jgi:hypothetical protein
MVMVRLPFAMDEHAAVRVKIAALLHGTMIAL